jgi:hypothetical protein
MAKKTEAREEPTLSQLISRTNKENPKPEDLALIRRKLDEDDALVKANEFGERAITVVMGTYTASALTRELYTRQVEDKRKELGYASASVMERMLINQVILCHLRMTTMEGFHAEKVRQTHSTETGYYWDRMLTTYQRRFQKACESLAKVRKLLAEANLHDQRARAARTSATKKSIDILKTMTCG